MASRVYAIGDIQGCWHSLQHLLAVIDFDPERDQLLLLGDLVNRGPESLRVLRWAYRLGDRVRVTLGNHDIHLLAAAVGARRLKPHDTLAAILTAPDRDLLLDWLRRQPLLCEAGDALAVHAGLHPGWSIEEARSLAGEVEQALRGDDWHDQLHAIYHSRKRPWRDHLTGAERLRAIIDILVRIRTCTEAGRLCKHVGPPETAPPGCHAWFELAPERFAGRVVLFGHWATLGVRIGDTYAGLDSGCVWGGQLSAMRLADRAVFQVPASE